MAGKLKPKVDTQIEADDRTSEYLVLCRKLMRKAGSSSPSMFWKEAALEMGYNIVDINRANVKEKPTVKQPQPEASAPSLATLTLAQVATLGGKSSRSKWLEAAWVYQNLAVKEIDWQDAHRQCFLVWVA